MSGKQWRPWSDAMFWGVWSRSTWFAQAYLSQYLVLLQQSISEGEEWSGGAKVSCILHHHGVQLILAYSWARPAMHYNVTRWNIMSSLRGVIFQWGSTLKVSIELPATSRHRRDMTERLLIATLSPNKTKQTNKLIGNHNLRRPIWAYTVCYWLSVRILRVNTVYANSWDPAHPEQLRTLIRTFAVRRAEQRETRTLVRLR